MFCPRCGRPVSDSANFCGGCGLPRAEIDRLDKEVSMLTDCGGISTAEIDRLDKEASMAVSREPEINPVDIEELKDTLSTLENDLTGAHPVENYTTNTADNTNKESINMTFDTPVQTSGTAQGTSNTAGGYSYYGQSAYSRQAPGPQAFSTSGGDTSVPQGDWHKPQPNMEALTTVDFIWMILIAGIPIVGLIYLFYQAFMQNDSLNKRNFARAVLIYRVFVYFLGVCLWGGIRLLLMMTV